MLISLLLNRYVLGAAIGILMLAGAYFKGYSSASQKCHDAELRATIQVLQRDIAIAKSAAADAADRALELEKLHSDANQKVQDYENELATRKGDSCGLNDADLMRLRGIYGPR